MPEQKTVVGSTEAVRNSLTMYEVDRVNSGDVSDSGRVYIGSDLAGEFVEYAVIVEGIVAAIGSKVDGSVTLNDVDRLDDGKILSNGYLFVGTEYHPSEVTVAVKVIDEKENQQTTES